MPQNYPILRSALRPEYAEAADDVVETVVSQLYGHGFSADDAENFFSGIGRAFNDFGHGVAQVAQQVAPVLGNALPGMLSGAATGAALGPWGALAGAAIGGVTSAISAGNAPRGGSASPSGGGRGGALGQFAGFAGPVMQSLGGMGGGAGALGRIAGMAMPAVQAFAGGDSRAGVGSLIGAAGGALGAAAPGGLGGQIAGLLARPVVQQAISAQMLGPFGRNQVSVGGTPVPTGAVMNMLATLFHQAAVAQLGHPGHSEALPAYLMDSEGEFAVDPADPDARGAWLAHLIASTPRPAQQIPHAFARQVETFDEHSSFDEYDEYDEYDEAEDALEVEVGYSISDLDEYDDARDGATYHYAS